MEMELQYQEDLESRMIRNRVAYTRYSPVILDNEFPSYGEICLLKETFNKFGNALMWAPLEQSITPHMCNDYWPPEASMFRLTKTSGL